MVRGMPTLAENNPIDLTGDYELPVLPEGKEVLLTAKGDFGGGTLTLQHWDHPSASWKDVIDGAFTANTEVRVVPPETGRLRLFLAGAVLPSISVTITQIR